MLPPIPSKSLTSSRVPAYVISNFISWDRTRAPFGQEATEDNTIEIFIIEGYLLVDHENPHPVYHTPKVLNYEGKEYVTFATFRGHLKPVEIDGKFHPVFSFRCHLLNAYIPPKLVGEEMRMSKTDQPADILRALGLA